MFRELELRCAERPLLLLQLALQPLDCAGQFGWEAGSKRSDAADVSLNCWNFARSARRT